MTCFCSISVLEPRAAGGKEVAVPPSPLIKDAFRDLMKDQLIRAIGKTLNPPGKGQEPAEQFQGVNPSACKDEPLPLRPFRQRSLADKAKTRNAIGAYTCEAPSMPSGRRSLDESSESFEVAIDKHDRRSSYGVAAPPPEFFCPISHCLMTEPVTLLNTGITFNRTSMQAWMRTGGKTCPVTGQPLQGWITLESNEKLRKRIMEWVEEQGINFNLLDNAAVFMHQLYAQAG